LISDGDEEEKRKKVLEIMADRDRKIGIGFLCCLIRTAVRGNWPVEEYQRVSDDTVRKLSYVLSLDRNQHSLGD